MTLLKTLIRPDREDENDERAEVAKAANLLQVGEFQVLQLAFHDWHKRDMPEALIDRLFADYMLYGNIPFWARQYARKIIAMDEEGKLNDREIAYHRYDSEYKTRIPDGLRKFIWAVSIIAFTLVGALVIAEYAARPGGSILPPYFERGNTGGSGTR